MIDALIELVQGSALFPATFKTVGKATDLHPQQPGAFETPALFFFPGGDKGGAAITHNPVNQEIVRHICVYVVGEVGEITDLVDALRPIIFTYKHSPQFPRLTLSDGKPFDIQGDMWWLETYKTEFNQR